MIRENVTLPFHFYCLTDIPYFELTPFKPLVRNYKGWWSKIELFRPGLFEEDRVLYFDLDTIILDNIDDMLIEYEDFIGLYPFNPKKQLQKGYMASGIMGWKNGEVDFLFNEFKYPPKNNHPGDQDYISDSLQKHGIEPAYWQNLVRGIGSYKRNLLLRKHHTFRVVCFHGKPRPERELIQDVRLRYESVGWEQ